MGAAVVVFYYYGGGRWRGHCGREAPLWWWPQARTWCFVCLAFGRCPPCAPPPSTPPPCSCFVTGPPSHPRPPPNPDTPCLPPSGRVPHGVLAIDVPLVAAADRGCAGHVAAVTGPRARAARPPLRRPRGAGAPVGLRRRCRRAEGHEAGRACPGRPRRRAARPLASRDREY